ncbi:MAG: xanthine dehydrogenase accessory protein XdhC [Rhodobacteraceae bacterium]|nr:xanthine dehydrogenase accessory protein XdhC [Paracoccaceae bacterium]
MGFDLEDLRDAVARHGSVVRVVIADLRGSSPREVGAAMLVWESGQSGTIGGGALEYRAAQEARGQRVPSRMSRHALGPDLGQCCGGSVLLLSEIYTADRLAGIAGDVIARPVADSAGMPMSVRRLLAAARARGDLPGPHLRDGWMIEPVRRPQRHLWIWGAGHVGRALVGVLAPLPEIAIAWVDTGPGRFPADVPAGIDAIPAAEPGALVRHAPAGAEHLILTYSHALDLELCHRLLGHDFAFAGLIGSATKWARFRSRLAALGHAPERIARITCPIGEPSLGKHPQAIALGVAAGLLRNPPEQAIREDKRA